MIISKLGKPKQKLAISKNEFNKEGAYQWDYEIGGYVRLSLLTMKDVLQSVSWEIWEADPEFDTKVLLEKLKANFSVARERVKNPHDMPTKCYLIDAKRGIRIDVDSYKKAATSISFWNPKFRGEIKKSKDLPPEFCITGHCSRVTDPDSWRHNHCKWLEKIVK